MGVFYESQCIKSVHWLLLMDYITYGTVMRDDHRSSVPSVTVHLQQPA